MPNATIKLHSCSKKIHKRHHIPCPQHKKRQERCDSPHPALLPLAELHYTCSSRRICGLRHVTVGIEDCIPMLVCPPNQVLGNPHGCIHLSITDQDTQFRKELIGHNPCRRAFAIGESILEIFTEDESSVATDETYVATDYTFVATDDEPIGTEYRFCCNRFQYEFFAYGASIIGWTNCRSIIMVHGIFLKAKYHSVLMIAVSKDGNNNIFPLAFGIADSENNESYNWFFNQLKHASKSSKQEEGWVVCRVFKKKNYHKALESPQNSSATLSRRGNMFPHADAILLKLVMHNWSNEDCVKILKRYREASTYNDEGRKEKVLIIDMVLNRDEDAADMTEVKLLFYVLMMVILARGGGQRIEKKWERLFLESGFMGYKIILFLCLKSLIQVFP
ncbi:hypothetical protein BC332_20559 [Capsicum chinense]|nr:hypothetical protein BC332_20559 [Capsicum chinense]